MNFKSGAIYHLYNRTFNHTLAFPTKANYHFFTEKLLTLRRLCDILSYCVMPDHFEIMIHVPDGSPGLYLTPNGQMQVLSRQIGNLLSSYARAYNKQQGRRGSLFQPKTKSRMLTSDARDCIEQIHSRPVSVGLTFKASDWEYSSIRDYAGLRTPKCNVALARILNLI